MRKASDCEAVRSAGANSWIVSSVDITLRKTVQPCFPRGMEMTLSPLFSLSKRTSLKKTPHLAHVDFIDERVEGEVHRLHRIHGIGEHTLPMGRHVHARVGDRRLYDAKGGERAARIKHRRDTRGRELVPLMVEAHGDDSASTITSHVEKTVRVLG